MPPAETRHPDPPVRDLAEALAHLRNVAQIPGRLIRTGSAAQLVLDALTAAEATIGRVRARHQREDIADPDSGQVLRSQCSTCITAGEEPWLWPCPTGEDLDSTGG